MNHLVSGTNPDPRHHAVFYSLLLHSHPLWPPIPFPAPFSVTLSSQTTNTEPQVLNFRTRSLVTTLSHTSYRRAKHFPFFPSETRATVENSIKFSANRGTVEFHCKSLKVAQNLDLFQPDAQSKHWLSVKVVA